MNEIKEKTKQKHLKIIGSRSKSSNVPHIASSPKTIKEPPSIPDLSLSNTSQTQSEDDGSMPKNDEISQDFIGELSSSESDEDEAMPM